MNVGKRVKEKKQIYTITHIRNGLMGEIKFYIYIKIYLKKENYGHQPQGPVSHWEEHVPKGVYLLRPLELVLTKSLCKRVQAWLLTHRHASLLLFSFFLFFANQAQNNFFTTFKENNSKTKKKNRKFKILQCFKDGKT